MEKYIISDKNGEYKSHCAEICLECEISNYFHFHLNLMKNRTVERNDGCIIYKFEFAQNLCGGTILTAKGNNKKLSF